MAKRGLPTEIKMRHDSHYVEELAKTNRTIGKVIPINQIEPNPEQPRVEIGDLTDLTDSIRQKGILEPLLVKPVRESGNWMIIAGERRWRAANLAGLREVPCIELDIDDKTIAEIALIENLQRKDLTVWEEADGLAALAQTFSYTHDEISKKISKSRTTVTESLTIAGIPENIREKCRAAHITAKSTLLEIARQFDDQAMSLFVDKIANQGLNRKEIRNTAKPLTTKILSNQNEGSLQKQKTFDQEKNTLENIFNYIAKDKDFSLEIRFPMKEKINKKDIMMALKEAYDSVRAS